MSAPDGHVPVLLDDVLDAARPVAGIWIDGTLGAGGYSRALLGEGAGRVIGIDRDPDALARVAEWAPEFGDRFTGIDGRFSELDRLAAQAGAPEVDGVVLDIGVSSMQLDQGARGFSFREDGPLDMRMAQTGTSAADIVNTAGERELADILFQYGEERASRRIAAAIIAARAAGPVTRTAHLAEIIAGVMPGKRKPGDIHPATRSFQALRIAVNGELRELVLALAAAEACLKPGGVLIVVSFHSLEDRIVKRFLAAASARSGGNRHAPLQDVPEPRFEPITRRAVVAGEAETARNPRARSARLRAARRTRAPARALDAHGLGLPRLDVLALDRSAS